MAIVFEAIGLPTAEPFEIELPVAGMYREPAAGPIPVDIPDDASFEGDLADLRSDNPSGSAESEPISVTGFFFFGIFVNLRGRFGPVRRLSLDQLMHGTLDSAVSFSDFSRPSLVWARQNPAFSLFFRS